MAQEPVLRALYFAKQQLNGFLVMKSLKRKRAQKMVPQLLALIQQFEQSPARTLAQMRISANVTADFGNVTDSAELGVAQCRL